MLKILMSNYNKVNDICINFLNKNIGMMLFTCKEIDDITNYLEVSIDFTPTF
jgi:hypothetical protein